MVLSKIKQANKKARREQKRKKRQAQVVKDKQAQKVRNKRIRKMMIEGRREDLRRRANQVKYIEQLEDEVLAND